MNRIAILILIGVVAGSFSGLIGIGGGVIVVPALVFILGFAQHTAQGTTLALMVPPIGILAAWQYWRQGSVDIKAAALICVGFVVGSWLGSALANRLSDQALERIFGIATLMLSVKMIWGR